jgi:RNA-directed DNA polymerase
MGFFGQFLSRLFGKPGKAPAKPAPQPAPPPAQAPAPPPGFMQQVVGPGQPVPPAPPPAPAKPQAATPPVPPLPTPLNLSADAFLPIARSELRDAAQDVRRGGAWFGRRDLIPPADDPRTKLIDRAMVTHGLLSPEQLVEIHQVGAQMDRHRSDLDAIERQAAQVGEAAVVADREQRAQIKAQKKAEAAERKKKHAEAVAQRRATDIVFLGRGVSGRLGERQSDATKLAALGLPVIHTPAELAHWLGLPVPRLRWLAFHTEVASRVHYVSFTVPKKSGGTRTLSAPHRTLAAAQQWVLANILGRLPVESPAHGFVSGRSTLSNATLHAGRAVIVNLDLQDFFPSITFPRVRSVFARLGYSPAVATVLALLCTECPRKAVAYGGKTYHVAIGPRGLPQGACTSPALSNQVARRLDKRLTGLATKLGLTYTRYADDLTFSGPAELNGRVGYLMARVRHIAQDEGFAVNAKKSRVQRRNAAQRVTGLVVNDKPGVGRREVRRLRAILHRARHEGLDKQNRTGRPNFRAWLEGMIAYVHMVRPEVGAQLKTELKAILSGERPSGERGT